MSRVESKSNVLDLVARLLATENISIYRKNVSKSNFNVRTRTLTIPFFKGLTTETETVLLSQEVGHAMYTTQKLENFVGGDKLLKQYASILDDIRVEKLLKNKYPGIAKSFYQGYTHMMEAGFFNKFFQNNFDSAKGNNLIDKINMYNKLGLESGVKFTEKEREFYNMSIACNTEEDVYKAALAILEYSKQNQEPQPEEEEGEGDSSDNKNSKQEKKGSNSPSSSGSNSSDNRDSQQARQGEDNSDSNAQDNPDENSSSDNEDGEGESQNAGEEEANDADDSQTAPKYSSLESETHDSLDNSSKYVDDSTENVYTRINENISLKRIVDYKTIIEDLQIDNSNASGFKTYLKDINNTVNYLTKEFEMRKNAQQLKRAAISKSGALDMRKLYAYKLKEEIFKTVTTLPNGKNHGIIFLLDWSGSMDNFIQETARQLIPLVLFCRRNQIKHKVFAFTDGYDKDSELKSHINVRTSERSKDGVSYLNNECGSFRLLEFFSDSMTNLEFKNMASKLYKPSFFRGKRGYLLCGTPLNDALAFMSVYIEQYLKESRVEKLSLITLTDGESDTLHALEAPRPAYNTNYNIVLKDFKTKREYVMYKDSGMFSGRSTMQTITLMKVINDRYNVATVGFYVGKSLVNKNDYQMLMRGQCESEENALPFYTATETIKKDGFVPLYNTGRDSFFYIPTSRLQMNSSKIELDASMSSEELAERYASSMNSKIKSKILLNRFIETIA